MVKLAKKTIFYIAPTKPFHFDSTFFKPGHFPSNDMKWEQGKRWQTMLFQGERLGTVFENVGTPKNPRVKVVIYSRKTLLQEFIGSVKNEVIWRYNLDLDLSGFYRNVSKDRLLKPVIKKFRGLRPMHHGSLYEYLIIDIVLQNTTVRRSVFMMQALFENYGTLLDFDGQKLRCFWEPAVLARAKEQELRNLKMGYRAKSLIKVSEAFTRKQINEMKLRKAPSEEQETALISLYGIGPASVGYIMFDAFHQWDFLKHISPWEQKIYSKIFFNRKLVSVETMLNEFSKWGRWKNLAIHYVWENIWWQRRNEKIPWLEKLIRL
jgi:3-methyladenine DNA glycosylase/8-oxoguanine DNA glycosylase